METTTIPLHKDIPVQYTWYIESVFPTWAEWETSLKNTQAAIAGLSEYQGQLGKSPDRLAKALELRERLLNQAGRLAMYAAISSEIDKTDQVAAGNLGKAQGLYGQVLAGASFIEPELIGLGQPRLQEWLAQSQELRTYAHYLDNLFRQQAHVRSAEVEELLGMLTDPFSNVETTAGLLTNADFKFPPAIDQQGREQPLGQSNFQTIMSSPDRQLRQSAWHGYLDTYLAFKNTLASNLVSSIKQNVFLARARRHPSTLEAALFQENIPVSVFYNLLETFQKNLPTWRRYFDIRRQALGLDRLEPYDLWAPLTPNRPRIPYEQAVDWICQGLAPLGQEYTGILRKGCLEERWVDVYPNQGKTSGAFSYGTPGTHPFIVMSYGDEIFSLSTLAHELGHSMHSYLTWKNQPLVYSNYSLFVAEVASNFHQAMVRAYLLDQPGDRDFQIGLIEEAMANFYRYFLIMPTLARFELETHQRLENGGALSADEAIDLMADLFQEAYGDSVYVDRPRVGMLWSTFGHLYADYYVFQYATGISGANALSRRILAGVPGAAEDYLGFLKSGSSAYALDVLKGAGVDLTTPQPVEQTFSVLSSLVDRLEKLLA
jgi:oligoendopeptidase F